MDKKDDICCNSACELICSVAEEEIAIAHILNAESEKLQKAIESSKSVDELLKVNCSVQKTIMDVTNLEIVLFGKLYSALCDNCCPIEPPIPPKPPCTVKHICISGVVIDACGNGIAGAEVRAFGKNHKFVKTDNCGFYKIEDLEVLGKFNIVAEYRCCRSINYTNCNPKCRHYTRDLQIKY